MIRRHLSLWSLLAVAVALAACSDAPTSPTPSAQLAALDPPTTSLEESAASFAGGDVFVEGTDIAAGLPVAGETFRAQLNIVAMATDPARGHFRWTLRSADGKNWRVVGVAVGDIGSVMIEGNEAHVHGIVQSATGPLASLVGEMFHSHLIDRGPSASEPDRVHWHWGSGPCPCEPGGGMGASMMWPVSKGNLVVREAP